MGFVKAGVHVPPAMLHMQACKQQETRAGDKKPTKSESWEADSFESAPRDLT